MTARPLGQPGRLLLLFGVVSLAAVVAGAVVCAGSGVPAGSWVRNVIAWAFGGAAAAAVAWASGPAILRMALWAAPVGLLTTLVSPDQQGVHRWVDVGPLHVNMAMLLLPGLIVALAASADRWASWIAVLFSLAVLAAQPDASEAATLAMAAAVIAVFGRTRPLIRWGVPAAAAGLGVVAWLQPDPLQPVAEVEGILGLAASISPLLAALAGLLLIGVAAAPALATRRLAGVALGLSFLIWAVMPLLGAYPVPLVGIGMSPIVGGWLGVGLLAALTRWNAGDGQARSAT